jgi:hypothetical protein
MLFHAISQPRERHSAYMPRLGQPSIPHPDTSDETARIPSVYYRKTITLSSLLKIIQHGVSVDFTYCIKCSYLLLTFGTQSSSHTRRWMLLPHRI